MIVDAARLRAMSKIARAESGMREGDPVDVLIAVIIIDGASTEGTILYANELAHRLAGWPPDGLLGQPLDVVIPVVSRGAHHHFRAGFMARPRIRPMGLTREIVLHRRDGRDLSVWVGLAPIGQGGRPNVMAFLFPQFNEDTEMLFAAERGTGGDIAPYTTQTEPRSTTT